MFLYTSLLSFYDPELEKLWSSISSIYQPTLEDYKLIEVYLDTGRPYLDILSGDSRYSRIKNFKLLGPKEEMPTFEKYSVNIREETKNRCILLFGSYNGIYYDKVYTLLDQIRDCGYSGHVLVRIGGFPNIQNGDLKLCHIPYAFKIAFLREAKALGFEEVLWIDSAIHPLTDLELIFEQLKVNGYFFTSMGTLHTRYPGPHPEAAKALKITPALYSYIPHIAAGVLGFNMQDPLALYLLDRWYIEVQKVTPCISWYPEELSLAVVAWSLGCNPICDFSVYGCDENQLSWAISDRPLLQFYLDDRR